MIPFRYDATNKVEKWEKKAEMRERGPLLKVERHFSPVESSSSDKVVLDGNALKGTTRKRIWQNKEDRSSAQEVKIINLVDLEGASTPKKRARTERLITHSKLPRRKRESRRMTAI